MKSFAILAILALTSSAAAAKRVDCGIWTQRCTNPPYDCKTCDDYGEGQVICGVNAPDLFCSSFCKCVN